MSYFSTGSRSGDALHVGRRSELPDLPLVDGIRARPIVGERLNIQEVVLEPGAVAPVHTHDEEQIGFVVSGEIEFTDGDSTWRLGPGDCYHAPPGVPHGATAGTEGCVVVDAFSPPREQIRALLAERDR
jgi:quercetin dioxygenase-like cupin family protein